MAEDTDFIKRKWSRSKTLWFYGLVSAVITGIAHSIAPVIVDPQTFNLGSGIGNLGKIAAVSGILGAATYLMKAPLPPLPKEYTEESSSITVTTTEVKPVVKPPTT